MRGERTRNVGRDRFGLVVGLAIIGISLFGVFFSLNLYNQATMGPSAETLSSGDFISVPIHIEEDAIRIIVRVDMDADHEMDIYLLEGERVDDPSSFMNEDTPAVRSAVAHQRIVEWSVPESEFREGLCLVIDNTDRGEVPATEVSIDFVFSVEMGSWANTFTNIGFYVWLMVTGVMLGIVVLTYRSTRGSKAPMEPTIETLTLDLPHPYGVADDTLAEGRPKGLTVGDDAVPGIHDVEEVLEEDE